MTNDHFIGIHGKRRDFLPFGILILLWLLLIPGGARGADGKAGLTVAAAVSDEDERLTPFIESHPNGRIDWDEGVLYGVGIGYLDKNGGLKNRALQAARATALQSLLKIASGLRLDDRETLKTLGNGRVAIQLKGLVRYDTHSVRFLKNADRPHIEVTLSAPLTGIEGLTVNLLDHLKGSAIPWNQYPRPTVPAPVDARGDQPETWLVLDARRLSGGREVLPALFPRILSPLGEPLYDLTMVDREALIRRGMAKYVVSATPPGALESRRESVSDLLASIGAIFTVRDAEAGEKKRKKKRRRRFIITNAKEAKGLNQTDLMLDNEDVKKLKSSGAADDILKKCRIIIVVNSPIGGVEGSLERLLASSPR